MCAREKTSFSSTYLFYAVAQKGIKYKECQPSQLIMKNCVVRVIICIICNYYALCNYIYSYVYIGIYFFE